MKAAQITKYSKNTRLTINEVVIPEIMDNEVLVKVKAAGVNPVDILIANGSIRLVQDYSFPLTLGNELAGVIEKVGKKVLFKLAGGKYDRMAAKQRKEYHFFFVKANGEQLQKVANILESNNIKPTLDSVYNFAQISQALDKVAQGHAQGNVVVTFE